MVAAVHAGNRPGTLSLQDLKAYKARKMEALCRPYRVLVVCSMGPPSSGGLAILSRVLHDRGDATLALKPARLRIGQSVALRATTRAGDAVAIGEGEHPVVFDFAPQVEIGAELLSRRGERGGLGDERLHLP